MWFPLRRRESTVRDSRVRPDAKSGLAAGILAVAVVVAVATPVLGNPRLRAGVERRVRLLAAEARTLPTATVMLDVPFHRQERALSCEAATLRMALAYRGVVVTERELLEAIGVDPAPRVRQEDGMMTWGDPDEAFVGDVDGKMGTTGYGVHARPIGRVAGRYRRAEVISGASAQVIVDAIDAGNPVISWGHIGRGAPIRWRTLGGKTVTAVNGEHTRVVIGYVGPSDAPTGFIMLDPIYGRQFWSLDAFLRNWEPLGRTAVIVS